MSPAYGHASVLLIESKPFKRSRLISAGQDTAAGGGRLPVGSGHIITARAGRARPRPGGLVTRDSGPVSSSVPVTHDLSLRLRWAESDGVGVGVSAAGAGANDHDACHHGRHHMLESESPAGRAARAGF